MNYASVIGMLLYLGHSRPYIAFATHQCARYTFAPKQSHKNALKRIGCYLKGTLDKGLILTPSDNLKIDCYPDTDFDVIGRDVSFWEVLPEVDNEEIWEESISDGVG